MVLACPRPHIRRRTALHLTPTAARRRLLALALLEGALVALVAFAVLWALPIVSWYWALLVGLVLGAVVLTWWCLTAPPRILRGLGVVEADEGAHPRYHNLVDGLCLSFGVDRPSLGIVVDPAPNAASLDGRGGAHLICTSGLLERLDRVQLEGVLAHELAHIRSGESAVATLAVAVIGYPLLGGGGPVARLADPVAAALAPWRERLWLWALGAERELDADLAAVGVTRYPPGLHAALRVIRDAGATVSSASPATVPLWIQEPAPAAARAGAAAAALHPPIDQRIDVLGEL